MGSIHYHRGYTLIELLVVLTVIVIVTMTVLTSQGSFNKSFILTNTAYDLALTLRFAEAYGLSSRVRGTVANTGYGLHFDKTKANSFSLFADTNSPIGGSGSVCHPAPSYDPTGPSAVAGDCVYTSSDAAPQIYTLNNGITIKDFCVLPTGVGATWACTVAHPGYLTGVNVLDIVFARPNPNAYITKNSDPTTILGAACITLTSAQGNFKYLYIGSTGQVSASANQCP